MSLYIAPCCGNTHGLKDDRMRKYALFILMLSTSCALHAQTRNLNNYVQSGIARSPALLDYHNQATIATLENKKVNAHYSLPSVYSTLNWLEAPAGGSYGYDEAITNGAWYAMMAGASIPLFTKYFVERETTMHLLEADHATWLGQSSEHELRRQITDAYLSCYADQELNANATALLDLVTQQYTLARSLAREGLFKASDILLLKIEVEHQQLQQQSFATQFRKDIAALNALCGITDTTAYGLSDPDLIYSDSITQPSAYVQQFVSDSLMNQQQQLLSELKYKPNVSAFADAGWNTSTLQKSYQNFGFSFGVNVSVPLFDGGQRDITRQETAYKLSTGTAYRTFFMDQRRQHLASHRQEIQRVNTQIETLQQQLAEYNSVLELYKHAMNSGDISITDYLVVFRNRMQTQQELIYQELQKNMAINAYNYWNW